MTAGAGHWSRVTVVVDFAVVDARKRQAKLLVRFVGQRVGQVQTVDVARTGSRRLAVQVPHFVRGSQRVVRVHGDPARGARSLSAVRALLVGVERAQVQLDVLRQPRGNFAPEAVLVVVPFRRRVGVLRLLLVVADEERAFVEVVEEGDRSTEGDVGSVVGIQSFLLPHQIVRVNAVLELHDAQLGEFFQFFDRVFRTVTPEPLGVELFRLPVVRIAWFQTLCGHVIPAFEKSADLIAVWCGALTSVRRCIRVPVSVGIPNHREGLAYRRLVRKDRGPKVLQAWWAVLNVDATRVPRTTLFRNHIYETGSKVTVTGAESTGLKLDFLHRVQIDAVVRPLNQRIGLRNAVHDELGFFQAGSADARPVLPRAHGVHTDLRRNDVCHVLVAACAQLLRVNVALRT